MVANRVAEGGAAMTWREMTKAAPCPICGHGDWCGHNGDAVRCMRVTDAPAGWTRIKSDDEGGTTFKPAGTASLNRVARRNFNGDAKRYAEVLPDDLLRELADALGVDADALRSINVGWNAADQAWTFPERDSAGQVVGINRRFRDGTKRSIKGGKRGLIIPESLDDLPGPVLAVEGASDVAACLTLSIAAVGRPNNKAGADLLAQLLRDRADDVLIVGENDAKDNDNFPGRDGAIAVAQKCANAWKRPVRWSMPLEGVKDVREWQGDRGELLAALEANAETVEPSDADDADDADPPKKSQATVIVELVQAAGVEFLHCDDEAYATIRTESVVETIAVKSRKFRRFCSRLYHKQAGRAPGSQAVQDALGVLEGIALFDSSETQVHVRIAQHGSTIYLDLANDERQVVEISATGWSVIESVQCLVRFRRPKALKALPVPERGGSWDDLRELINVEDYGFILIVAFLLATFRPGVPIPVLLLNSEQGSGKSTASRMIRLLIDPNAALLRSEPREARDLMIAASNGYLIALDNLSHVPSWLSDALCRLSTGGGFSTRTLYENDEETIFDALRPVLLNGIEELATRSDLLDRCIRVSLPTIPEERRKPESELWRQFDRVAPGIIGLLLDAVVLALRNVETVELDRLPRMADFARWIIAAEDAVPWQSGEFIRAYADVRDSSHELAIEANPIGPVLLDFARAVGSWEGSASDLLHVLSERAGDAARRKGWPTRANVLSGILTRLTPNLRHLGVVVDRGRSGHTRQRVIRVWNSGADDRPDRPHLSEGDSEAENTVHADDVQPQADDRRTMDRPAKTALAGSRTHADDSDDELRTHSKGGDEWTY
jgi:hypothetical protein